MTQSTTSRFVVARSDDIPERGRVVISAAGREVGIFRVDSELYAWENYCVHAGGPICQGLQIPRVVEVLNEQMESVGEVFSEEDLHIVCPWHGYEYNVKTGEHPADARIHLTAVSVVEENGEVVVEF